MVSERSAANGTCGSNSIIHQFANSLSTKISRNLSPSFSIPLINWVGHFIRLQPRFGTVNLFEEFGGLFSARQSGFTFAFLYPADGDLGVAVDGQVGHFLPL